ncbi:FecR family protein [uncultured Massilia sp.]|uniref:FecR family protein n=1 Tax=uncultured Massilia sp. TaxID=169973 RepID=UPI0025DF8ED1|nr:FecR family protein [uncultured Massilia sp.]
MSLRHLFVIGSLAVAAHAGAAEAGKVIFAAGAAKVADRAGAEGLAVQEGELLSTGADGFLYVKTVDNGLFILRPNTEARIVAYHVDTREPKNTRVKLELIKGVARSKSGEAVKLARQNFRFNTPVAAIGVRGTDFTVYTDQDTSRVAVLTGGVVVSGFVGACRPDGVGPCEGTTSRELSAAQRGQLLQVQRGQSSPQLLQGGANAPDLVSPPRADEPVAKAGTGASSSSSAAIGAEPSLDPRKSQALAQLVSNNGGGSTPTQPSQPQQPGQPQQPQEPQQPQQPQEPQQPQQPQEPQQPQQPQEPQQPQQPVDPTPPVTPLPDRQIVWGRWTPVAGRSATVDLTGEIAAGNTLLAVRKNYALLLTPGADYVADTRGTVAFDLRGSEAYIYPDAFDDKPAQAQVRNGHLSVDFGARSFSTGFDVVTSEGDTYKMHADGVVGRNGRLYGNDFYKAPTNMSVDGVLSGDKGGSAAYIFDGRIDATHFVNGATYWGVNKQ